MGSPNSSWPHDGEVPEHDPALRVASRKALILSHERGGVYLGLVPS